MGKGQTASLMAALEMPSGIALLETRARWAPMLEEELNALVLAAPLFDGSQMALQAERLAELYARGGNPDWWMHNFRASLRLKLARELMSEHEHNLKAALAVLRSPDLSFNQRVVALDELISLAGRPEDRSIARHVLAEHYFTGGKMDRARRVLKDDLADPDMTPGRAALSQDKLDFLDSLPDPVGWEEGLIPPPIREQRPEYWQVVLEHGLGDAKGDEAGAWFVSALARSGFPSQALELCDRLEASQWQDKGKQTAGRARFDALDTLDRKDQRMEALGEPFSYRLPEVDRMAERMDKQGLEEQAEGFRLLARQIARFRMDSAPGNKRTEAKRDLVFRLVDDGLFAEAMVLLQEPQPFYDPLDDSEYRLIVLANAAEADPDTWLPALRALVYSPGFSFSRVGRVPAGQRAERLAFKLFENDPELVEKKRGPAPRPTP